MSKIENNIELTAEEIKELDYAIQNQISFLREELSEQDTTPRALDILQTLLQKIYG